MMFQNIVYLNRKISQNKYINIEVSNLRDEIPLWRETNSMGR